MGQDNVSVPAAMSHNSSVVVTEIFIPLTSIPGLPMNLKLPFKNICQPYDLSNVFSSKAKYRCWKIR